MTFKEFRVALIAEWLRQHCKMTPDQCCAMARMWVWA
jgi:hypothetical protein